MSVFVCSCHCQRNFSIVGAINDIRQDCFCRSRTSITRVRWKPHEEGRRRTRPLHGSARERRAEGEGAGFHREGKGVSFSRCYSDEEDAR